MKNSLGQKIKIKMGLESDSERKKRVAQEKKENKNIIEYFDKINRVDPKPRYPSISTQQFKALLWKEGKQYFRKMNRDFVVDESNMEFLDLMCNYWTNSPLFESKYKGELRKGLLIYGPCGTGKSSIFDIIQNISKKYHLMQFWFTNVSVHDVITQYNLEGEYVVEKFVKGKVHFDDLGTEKLANSWGVKEKLLGRILELRYNEFKQKGTKTFVTTNLPIKKLETYYEARVSDRLYEMFNFVELGGKSRRY